MTILVSPAEPAALRAIGEVSSQCEQWGCDFLLFTKSGLVGVQRKTYADWLASLRGDRIGRELSQMADSPVDHIRWVIEGTEYDWQEMNGRLASRKYGKPVSRWELIGFLEMLTMRGMGHVNTRDMADTAEYLVRLQAWMDDTTHVDRRLAVPKARGASLAERLLMTLPSCSLTKARIVTDRYPTPFALTVSRAELEALPRFAKKSVEKTFGELL